MTHFAWGVGHRTDDPGLRADHGRKLFDSDTSENADEQFALKSILQARLVQYCMSQLGFAADKTSAPRISLVIDCLLTKATPHRTAVRPAHWKPHRLQLQARDRPDRKIDFAAASRSPHGSRMR